MSSFLYSDLGLTIQTLDDIVSEMGAALKLALSAPDLLTDDPASPEGALIGILAERESLLQENVEAAYFGAYPQTATGVSFMRAIRMAGISVKPATPSAVTLTLHATAAMTVPAGSLVAVTQIDGLGAIYSTDADLVFPAAGSRDVTATAIEMGPDTATAATAGTITTIVTAVANWDTVTNALAATPGTNMETDSEALVRMKQSFSGPGQSPIDALRAQLLAIAGVAQVLVLENTAYYVDPTTTDAAGTLGKAIRCIVWPVPAHTALPAFPTLGSVEEAIAAAIWHGKTDGALAQGLVATKTRDTAGHEQPIAYEVAISEPWNVTAVLTPAATATEIAAIKAAILAFEETVLIGGIVDYLQVAVAIVQAAPGKTDYDVGIAKNSLHNPAWLADTTDLTWAAMKILTIVDGDIHIT